MPFILAIPKVEKASLPEDFVYYNLYQPNGGFPILEALSADAYRFAQHEQAESVLHSDVRFKGGRLIKVDE